jgi:hypothetical protein
MNSQPLLILQTLERHLAGRFELYVYGRSALALGFPAAPQAMHATMDVDAILPTRDLMAIEANDDFWRAQEATNRELDDTGLYFTHLFEEKQVVLGAAWLSRVVPLSLAGFCKLSLFRPGTEDLVLTKMMRIDPQDREDILFLLGREDYCPAKMRTALAEAVIPGIPEIRDAFKTNLVWLLPHLATSPK